MTYETQLFQRLALFAQCNNWGTVILGSRSELPPGLPDIAYVPLNVGLPWNRHDYGILIVNGTYNHTDFEIIYLTVGFQEMPTRYHISQTYMLTKHGVSEYGWFVSTKEMLKDIIEGKLSA